MRAKLGHSSMSGLSDTKHHVFAQFVPNSQSARMCCVILVEGFSKMARPLRLVTADNKSRALSCIPALQAVGRFCSQAQLRRSREKFLSVKQASRQALKRASRVARLWKFWHKTPRGRLRGWGYGNWSKTMYITKKGSIWS